MATDRNNREYELKFRAGADDLPRFKAAVDAIDAGTGEWTVADLHSRYFDTEDRRLDAMGVSLRIRQTNGISVLTVKAKAGINSSAGSGVMDRWEWEHAISGTDLDLASLPPDALRALGDVSADDLVPIIDVSYERHAKIVRRNDPLGPEVSAEAVADLGSVTAGGRSEDIAECELELGQGNLASFFALAADIIEICPLAVSSTSKSGRGYALLSGAIPRPHKLAKFMMSDDLSVHQCLERIFSACIGNITANETACILGEDTEGVHQMRVSIRKLRSALKIFRRFIDPAHAEWINADLKWMGNCLGPARDWDVFLDETLPSMAALGIDGNAIDALRRAGAHQRSQAYDGVRNTLSGERYAKMMMRLTAFLALQSWRAPNQADAPAKVTLSRSLRKAAPGILRRSHRKLLKAGSNLAELDMDARHAVRIQIKRMRYAVDFLRGVFPGAEMEAFGSALRNLQDNFGKLNDVVVAVRLTDALIHPGDGATVDEQIQLAAGEVRGWNARALKDIEPDLLADWEEFAGTKPFWEKSRSH